MRDNLELFVKEMAEGNGAGMPPELRIVEKETVRRVLDEAHAILERIGVFVENDEARDLLLGSGAKEGSVETDGDRRRRRILIPGSLAERCLASVPRTFPLYDRDGNHVTDVGGASILFNPGSAALGILDPATRRQRKPTSADCARFVHLVDGLPNYAAQSTAIVPADVPEPLADRHRLYFSLTYGRKPVITGTFSKDAFATMKEMLVVASGSTEALRRAPRAIFDCCPSPPLRWSDLTCQALIDCARAGIPAELVSMPLTGATAPVTLLGAVVQHAAENLSGITIHQLAAPGAPIVYGGSPSAFDMRTGMTPMGAIETMMIDATCARIGRHIGVPTHAYMGLSDSKVVDYQAGSESSMGLVLAALAGVNVVSGPGMLDFEKCQSFEKIVLDHEVCGMALRLRGGVASHGWPAALADLEVAAASGDFLRLPSTRAFFRKEFFFPDRELIDRADYAAWEGAGARDAWDRATGSVEARLAQPPVHLLDESKRRELVRILLAESRRRGVKDLPGLAEPAQMWPEQFVGSDFGKAQRKGNGQR